MSAATSGSVEQAEFPVTGMSCASCAARVERTLTDVPGVARATVNFATARARVEWDGAAVTPARLAGAVREQGYELGLAAGESTEAGDTGPPDPEPAAQRMWRRRVL